MNTPIRLKYTPPEPTKKLCKQRGRPGRYVNPEKRKYPDPMVREKYYAYLKHRSQAQHRGELYEITEQQWLDLWTDELFMQRGRTIDSLCLRMIAPSLGWSIGNVEIVSRRRHFNKIWGKPDDAE